MLGKPIAESSALCIPTATYPMGGPGSGWRFITGRATTPDVETDALPAQGGDALYLRLVQSRRPPGGGAQGAATVQVVSTGQPVAVSQGLEPPSAAR